MLINAISLCRSAIKLRQTTNTEETWTNLIASIRAYNIPNLPSDIFWQLKKFYGGPPRVQNWPYYFLVGLQKLHCKNSGNSFGILLLQDLGKCLKTSQISVPGDIWATYM